MAQDNGEWLDIEDIYERLGKKVPRDSIREWIRTGRLRGFRPGKVYLVRREDFEKFMKDAEIGRDKDKD